MISNYAERHGVILPPSGLVQTVFSSVRLHFVWKGDMERWMTRRGLSIPQPAKSG